MLIVNILLPVPLPPPLNRNCVAGGGLFYSPVDNPFPQSPLIHSFSHKYLLSSNGGAKDPGWRPEAHLFRVSAVESLNWTPD
jgi:hypothetical protein